MEWPSGCQDQCKWSRRSSCISSWRRSSCTNSWSSSSTLRAAITWAAGRPLASSRSPPTRATKASRVKRAWRPAASGKRTGDEPVQPDIFLHFRTVTHVYPFDVEEICSGAADKWCSLIHIFIQSKHWWFKFQYSHNKWFPVICLFHTLFYFAIKWFPHM